MSYEEIDRPALLEECQELAESPSLITTLAENLKQLGFAGDPRVPFLIWLATFTGKDREKGKASRPASVLIKGNSGAGKSYSLHSALQLVPDDEYELLSGMSEKALIYWKDKDLKHKHLIIGEAAGFSSGDGRAFLRQFLSEGEIRYATAMKDKSGQIGTVELRVEGPTGAFITTTATKLHHEDETRMLSVNVPESREQMKAALFSVVGASESNAEPVDFEPWHAFHRWVTSGPQEVVVPYAAAIVDQLPLHHDRIKRDFYQVVVLLQACALVHQNSRERDDQDRVVANRQDYEVVHYLLDEALSENLAVSVSPAVRDVVEAVKILRTEKEPMGSFGDAYWGVSHAQIAKHLDRDRSAISRSALKAVDLGYLVDTNPGKGRTSELYLGDVGLPSGTVLPHPDELFGREETMTIQAAE